MSKRVSIEVPGFEHDNPIPAACRKGPFLITSGVSGKQPHTGKYPEGVDAQFAQMFETIRKILDAAGASVDDIVKINVWLKDRDMRPHVNKEWLWRCFPIRIRGRLGTRFRVPTCRAECWCSAK